MATIYKSAAELIGNTPLLEVTNIEKELGLKAKVLVKLEYFNPAGSVKDRIAHFRKHRYRSCGDRSREGLPHHPDDARDYERGETQYFESIRSGACPHRGFPGHEGRDRQGC